MRGNFGLPYSASPSFYITTDGIDKIKEYFYNKLK